MFQIKSFGVSKPQSMFQTSLLPRITSNFTSLLFVIQHQSLQICTFLLYVIQTFPFSGYIKQLEKTIPCTIFSVIFSKNLNALSVSSNCLHQVSQSLYSICSEKTQFSKIAPSRTLFSRSCAHFIQKESMKPRAYKNISRKI